MPLAGDPLSTSVAAVVERHKERPRGTAFFVGSDVALTCSHVIRDIEHEDIQVVLGPSDQEHGVKFEALPRIDVLAVDDDPDLDLALLRLKGEPTADWHPLSTEWTVGDEVFSRGYQKSVGTYPGGHPVAGKIVGTGPVVLGGRQSEALTLADISIDRGISGGPLVHKPDGGVDPVLGVIRIKAGEDNAHAIPAKTVLSRWPGLTSVGPEDKDVGPAPDYAQLVGSGVPTLDCWPTFEPARMHCIVVESEAGQDDEQPLRKLVPATIENGETRAWRAFHDYWRGRRLVCDGSERVPSDAPNNITSASFNVLDAFSTFANLGEAVRLVVEADVGVFDVTDFEPGVMMLLGVRAAARRGVTIVSHGNRWYLGQPLNRPFNLSDLSIASHTWEGRAGDDPREEPMLKSIEEGYRQLTFQPRYLDTPAYRSVRDLGPDFEAWKPIPLSQEVIVLCSYGKDYLPVWQDLQNEVRKELKNALGIEQRPIVARVQDLPTPQLASQLLYEKIRRCDGCVGDWTYNSASTFFEIGVRLAISPKSLVQTVERGWLDDDAHEKLAQIDGMIRLFSPLEYTAGADKAKFDPTIGARIASQLEGLTTDTESLGHPIRTKVVEAVRRTEPAPPTLLDHLTDAANALHHEKRERDEKIAGTQALFSDVMEIKANSEATALDLRVAAWLYLEYRLHAGDEASTELHSTWRQLGRLVVDALYDVDLDLALVIEERLGPE